MKFGCCAGYNEYDKLRMLARLGFDYVECNFSALSDATLRELAGFRSLTEQVGLPCEAANVFFKGNIRLTGPDVDYSVIRAYLEPAVDKARLAGIKRIVFGSGGARKVPDGFPMDEAYDQLADICRNVIGPIVAAYNITVAIETLNKGETNIINTVQEGLRVVYAADHPNIQLLVDLYHLALENDPLIQLASLGDVIQHAHIANPLNKRYIPRPTDSPEALELYENFFRQLKRGGYDQRISIEAGVESDFETEAAESLKMMRHTCENVR